MKSSTVRAVALVPIGLLALAPAAGAQPAAHRPPAARLTVGAARPTWATATTEGAAVPAARPESVTVWLKPRNQAELAALLHDVSTPGTSRYRQFLTPAQYTARFAATPAAASAVRAWLLKSGFEHVTIGAQRDQVVATGTAAAASRAFAVTLHTYRAPAGLLGTTAQIPDTDPTLPAAIAASVSGITGLTAVPAARPRGTSSLLTGTSTASTGAAAPAGKPTAPKPSGHCSYYYGQFRAKNVPAAFGLTAPATEICGYIPRQVRAAYGLNMTNTGRGVTVAIDAIGLVPRMYQSLQHYSVMFGLPHPSRSQYAELTWGQGSRCGNFDVEEALDVESVHTAAPGANILVVGADSCDAAKDGADVWLASTARVVDGNGTAPLATIMTESWGFPEIVPGVFDAFEETLSQRAIAEGVGLYFSTGDSPGPSVPASSPNVTAVGGTTVGIGQQSRTLFQTGWSNDISFLVNGKQWTEVGIAGAGGGGASLLFAQPEYQRGVVPAAMATAPGNRAGLVRTTPDLSALADPATGFRVGFYVQGEGDKSKWHYVGGSVGGTSVSAPLVAGMVADAQQGQRTAFGFLNPLLYSLRGSSALTDVRPLGKGTKRLYRGIVVPEQGVRVAFDDEDPWLTSQVTARGYDTMTGLGTPDGQAFVAALRAGAAG